jgi:hypothetical protein
MRGARGRRDGGQSWATFVKNHAERMWACDFIRPTSRLRPLELLRAVGRLPAVETIVMERATTSMLGRAVERRLAERAVVYGVRWITLHSIRHRGRVVGWRATLSTKSGVPN